MTEALSLQGPIQEAVRQEGSTGAGPAGGTQSSAVTQISAPWTLLPHFNRISAHLCSVCSASHINGMAAGLQSGGITL